MAGVLNLRGHGHALELEVVAYFHAWLDEAVSVFDADTLVAKGHICWNNYLHLGPSL